AAVCGGGFAPPSPMRNCQRRQTRPPSLTSAEKRTGSTSILGPHLAGYQVYHLWYPLLTKVETGCPYMVVIGLWPHRTPALSQSTWPAPPVPNLVSRPRTQAGADLARSDHLLPLLWPAQGYQSYHVSLVLCSPSACFTPYSYAVVELDLTVFLPLKGREPRPHL
ncbi:mCG145409, partial [Mus musculus]